MSDFYQLDGTEICEVQIREIDCGQSVKTIYRNAQGEIVRQDIEIKVDAEKLPKLGAESGKVNF